MADPSIPGYKHDINQLLVSWLQKEEHTFSTFKQIWRSLSFSYIHRGSAPNVPPEQYTQALFRVC